MVEEWEEDLEDWYYNKQDENLMEYLCRDRILKYGDKGINIIYFVIQEVANGFISLTCEWPTVHVCFTKCFYY